ncbi:MAG: hypothetical protein IJY18_02310 [Clostridia bacterium]|nr:hypothetical protein [Clostridia bacterium]
MSNIETEYKLIVEKPDIENLSACEGYTESEILQIYLESPAATHRVRRRVYSSGKVEYTENKKIRISKMSAIEEERVISEEEFFALAEKIEKGAKPLKKIRRTVKYLGYTYEFDFYEDWKSTCIMEVELPSEDTELVLPPLVRMLKNVTGEKMYSNHSMAHVFPPEII